MAVEDWDGFVKQTDKRMANPTGGGSPALENPTRGAPARKTLRKVPSHQTLLHSNFEL